MVYIQGAQSTLEQKKAQDPYGSLSGTIKLADLNSATLNGRVHPVLAASRANNQFSSSSRDSKKQIYIPGHMK